MIQDFYTKTMGHENFSDCVKAFFLLLPTSLLAMLVGNPGEPAFETKGLFTPSTSWCTVRATFFEDYVYNQRFLNQFTVAGMDEPKTFAKLTTNAGMLIVNFKNRLDLYGIGGTSRLQVNQEIFSKMQGCWGFGGKFIIHRTHAFYIGTDIKYFATDQKPLYFLSDGLPFNVVGDFELHYSETQFALGVSFLTQPLSPYIYGTYLIAKFDPHPMTALVQWPLDTDVLVDAVLNSATSQRRFGIALGATFLSGNKASLAIESRMFNQNAVDVKLEIRF